MPNKTVWIIRHAESESNAGLPTTSPDRIPITTKGQLQSQELVKQFVQAPDLIVTSKYIRTQQTAQPLLEAFPDVAQEEWNIHEFTYLAPHRYHKTTLHDRRPHTQAYWQRADPTFMDGEGAESFVQLMERVEQTRTQLQQIRTGFTAIFCHGHFMKALLWAFIRPVHQPITQDSMRQFHVFHQLTQISNGCILKLSVQDNGECWVDGVLNKHLTQILD